MKQKNAFPFHIEMIKVKVINKHNPLSKYVDNYKEMVFQLTYKFYYIIVLSL